MAKVAWSLLGQSASGLNLMTITDTVRYRNKSLHSVIFPSASRMTMMPLVYITMMPSYCYHLQFVIPFQSMILHYFFFLRMPSQGIQTFKKWCPILFSCPSVIHLFVQDAAPGVQPHDCGVQSSSFCAHQKLIGPAGEEVKVSIKKQHQMALCSTCLILFQCWWPGHCCVSCSDRMSGPVGGLYWLTRFPGKGIFKEILSRDLLRPAMLL